MPEFTRSRESNSKRKFKLFIRKFEPQRRGGAERNKVKINAKVEIVCVCFALKLRVSASPR